MLPEWVADPQVSLESPLDPQDVAGRILPMMDRLFLASAGWYETAGGILWHLDLDGSQDPGSVERVAAFLARLASLQAAQPTDRDVVLSARRFFLVFSLVDRRGWPFPLAARCFPMIDGRRLSDLSRLDPADPWSIHPGDRDAAYIHALIDRDHRSPFHRYPHNEVRRLLRTAWS